MTSNTTRSPAATALRLAAALLAAAALLTLHSRTTPAALAAAAQPAAAPDARPPSASLAMSAYGLVEGWVREWSAPETPGAAGLDALGPWSGSGAAVTLRLAGQVIGRGSDTSGGPESLWRAAREAMAQATPRLPRGRDLLAADALGETTGQIMISLELAGPMLVMAPPPATYDEVSLALAHGLEGVAVRFGAAGASAAMFPGQMLATNTLPGAALAAAAAQAGGAARPGMGLIEPAELVSKHGATLLRFRVTHLAQTAPGQAPEFLDRGGRTVTLQDTTAAGLRASADSLALHLLGRLTAGDSGAGAVYEPWRDNPAEARPLSIMDRALVIAALRRYSALNQVYRRAAGTVHQERRFFEIELEQELGRPGSDPSRHSATELAIAAALSAGFADTFSVHTNTTLRAAFSAEHGFAADVPPAARSVIAYGLASLAAFDDAPADAAQLAAAAVRAVFRQTPEGELPAQMPWLGWAEVRLADLERDRAGGDGEVPAAVALRRMRERLWEYQLTPALAGADEQDLVGGIVFTKGRTAIPTWSAARPLAFAATMLGDARLTEPAELNAELVRLLTSLRFLRQLQVDEHALWMYPSRQRALGGIRSSPWDQRMPIEASALTLMTLCEALASLQSRANAR